MKAIVLGGVIAVVAIAIFAALSIMQRQETDKLVQADASRFFHEKQQEKAVAGEATGDAFNRIVKPPTRVSGPSWVNRLQNAIEDGSRHIKNLPTILARLTHPHHAPPGVYFTLTYISVRNPSGITGVNAGTQVVCVKDEGPVLLVKAGNLEFEAQRQYLTNDLDIADLTTRGDAEAEQTVALYIAQQKKAIDQPGKTKTRPSSQH
jgi:hypothetical protein